MAYFPAEQLTDDDQYVYWVQIRATGDPVLLTARYAGRSRKLILIYRCLR